MSSFKASSAGLQSAPLKLRIRQIESVEQFQPFSAGITALLQFHQSTLRDDFSQQDIQQLVQNTLTYVPWLWVLTDDAEFPKEKPLNSTTGFSVYGLACLSDIIPGRHAYVHGASHPAIRRHPAISELGHWVLYVAFQQLKVRKVKAEIEANNWGAKGYCRRMGFVREAHFRQDIRINGQWQDVLVYSLFAEKFQPLSPEISC